MYIPYLDLDIIYNLIEKKGGISEAGLAVQYLYKRKLMVKTGCILHGTRYFLLK